MSFAVQKRCLAKLNLAVFTHSLPHTSIICRRYAMAALKQNSGSANSPSRRPEASPSEASSTKKEVLPVKTKRKVRTSGGTSYVIPEEKATNEPMTEEEQMAQLEQLMAMARTYPTADPWGQRVETLDVMLPLSTKLGSRKSYATWGEMLKQFVRNRFNAAKNATSMVFLAQANAIPGVDLSESKFLQKYVSQWPWRVFTTNSISEKAWLAPFRRGALETYQKLNAALAMQNDKAIKHLTTSAYQDSALRLLKKSQNPALTYIWKFHREVTPTRVLSIRSTEGYLANEEPKFGNRMMLHALVKFDTEQSLEIYDKRGKALHTPYTGTQATKPPSAGQKRVPAEPRRVTEYLVLEKRMWYDGPWTFREQVWPPPGRDVSY